MRKSVLAFSVVALLGISKVQASPGDTRPERRTPPMAEMARDTYGDKTLIELNTEIELLQNDLALLRDEYAKHNARITGQITRLRHIINDRQQAINFIRRDREQRYFSVHPGSLRGQLESLRFALGLQAIRWSKTVPAHCDWQFDAGFEVDKKEPIKALEAFLAGLPLLPQIHERDRSATITATEIIKCD